MIVNRGNAVMLFIALIIMSNNAEDTKSQADKVSCTFIFSFILVALAGAM